MSCTSHRGELLDLLSDRELFKIFFNQFDAHFISRVAIESSSFQGGQGPFFTVHQAQLVLSKTVFHIQSHRTRPENLIDFQGVFRSKDVLINLTSTDKDLLQVNIMSAGRIDNVNIENIQIMCPFGMAAVETVPISKSESRVYQCKAACTSNMYTFQS